MTTLKHREYREKKGFADLAIPNEMLLEYTSGGEVFGSEINIPNSKKKDIEVGMFLSRPSCKWRILIHEKGFGGCCLLDSLTTCKTKEEALIELIKECKRIFKKDIKLELETVAHPPEETEED